MQPTRRTAVHWSCTGCGARGTRAGGMRALAHKNSTKNDMVLVHFSASRCCHQVVSISKSMFPSAEISACTSSALIAWSRATTCRGLLTSWTRLNNMVKKHEIWIRAPQQRYAWQGRRNTRTLGWSGAAVHCAHSICTVFRSLAQFATPF